VLQADGRIVVVGRLAPITPPNPSRFPSGRYYAVRYLADGSLDPSWNIFTSGSSSLGGNLEPVVQSAFLRANGNLFTSVYFANYAKGLIRNESVAYDSVGNQDPAFKAATQSSGLVGLGLQDNGLVMAGFASALQFLDATGALARTVDVSATAGNNAWVKPAAVQSDGKILYSFGLGFTGLGRIWPDGSPDHSFDGVAAQAALKSSTIENVIEAGGKFLVSSYSLLDHTGFVTRLGPDGKPDDTFTPAILLLVGLPNAIALDKQGGLLVAGAFSIINGLPAQNLARIRTVAGVLPIRLSAPVQTTESFRVSVQTVAGANYLLEYQSSLNQTNWTALLPVRGTGGVLTLRDTNRSGPRRFYRIRVQ